MRRIIEIPGEVGSALHSHFFQNELEQGAFLFAKCTESEASLILTVEDFYLVPESGWDVQDEIYLELNNDERAKVMKVARDRRSCLIDCHSHPFADADVWFSPSDCRGIAEFAQYTKWKLENRPFGAMVWGENSLDAIIWHSDFRSANRVDEVIIGATTIRPRDSWFRGPRGKHRFSNG